MHFRRPALIGKQHLHDKRLTVRALPHAVAVAVFEPHLVEQRLGFGHIVLRICRLVFVRDKRHGIRVGRRGLNRGALVEVDQLIHLIAVDGQRHRLAKANVIEDLAQNRIFVGGIKGVINIFTQRFGEMNGVVALGFILFVERKIGQKEVLNLVVDFAIDHFEIPHLFFRHVAFVDGIDVRQLIAGRVHHVKIRVGHQVPALGRLFNENM